MEFFVRRVKECGGCISVLIRSLDAASLNALVVIVKEGVAVRLNNADDEGSTATTSRAKSVASHYRCAETQTAIQQEKQRIVSNADVDSTCKADERQSAKSISEDADSQDVSELISVNPTEENQEANNTTLGECLSEANLNVTLQENQKTVGKRIFEENAIESGKSQSDISKASGGWETAVQLGIAQNPIKDTATMNAKTLKTGITELPSVQQIQAKIHLLEATVSGKNALQKDDATKEASESASLKSTEPTQLIYASVPGNDATQCQSMIEKQQQATESLSKPPEVVAGRETTTQPDVIPSTMACEKRATINAPEDFPVTITQKKAEIIASSSAKDVQDIFQNIKGETLRSPNEQVTTIVTVVKDVIDEETEGVVMKSCAAAEVFTDVTSLRPTTGSASNIIEEMLPCEIGEGFIICERVSPTEDADDVFVSENELKHEEHEQVQSEEEEFVDAVSEASDNATFTLEEAGSP
uniref:Uncharacterized protein n=1 Tax=Parascaris equorum TaxID=6256 RepID=A0A914RTA3_PAREQ